MLGAAQADAFRAELDGLLGIAGVVRVGKHFQLARGVGPAHEAAKIAGDGGFHRGHGLAVDVARGAVDGDPVALVVGLAGKREAFFVVIYDDIAAAGHAAGTHTAGHNGRVAGHAAAHRQDALRHGHAFDVLGAGLQTDQNDLLHLAAFNSLFGFVGGEHHLAAGGARRGGQALADDGGGLQRGRVKLRMQQAVQLLGLHAQHGFLFGDHALIHQVHGDLQRGGGGALAVARLQHIQLAVLDGELHVLHVAIVVLKLGGDGHELVVDLRHLVFQVADGGRRTDAGHHVLALGVDEVFAEQGLLAGGGVAGERHARAGVLAGVAEHHGLYVDGGAPVVGNLVHAAVGVGAGVVPAAEHGLNGLDELRLRVGGEVRAHFFLVERFEFGNKSLHVVGVQLHVLGDALGFLHLVDDLFEFAFVHLHDNVAEHLHKAAVAVIGEAGVARLFGQTLNNFVVQAQVEDGIHHTGHGSARARTDGNQQGVGGVAELLADDLLHLADILVDVGHDAFVDLAAVVVILGAGLGADGEALGNRHAGIGHLGKVSALAAEDLTHVLVPFTEQVQVFFVTQISLPPNFFVRGKAQNPFPCTNEQKTCPFAHIIITKSGGQCYCYFPVFYCILTRNFEFLVQFCRCPCKTPGIS